MSNGEALVWTCPSCGAIQEESRACWVCATPTTGCGTCRHVRRSVAGRLSFCGIDRRRRPVLEESVEACWTAPVALQTMGQLERRIDGGEENRPRLTWGSGGLWEGLEA
jgi:hypothetical protein